MATRKSPSKSPAARKRTATTARTAGTTRRRAVTAAPVEAVETVSAVAVEATPARTGFYNRYPVAALIAEFLGTFIFVGFIIGLSTASQQFNATPLYAFFAGIVIVTLFGRLSGPHLNPAITIGAWLARFITGRTALFYIIAQILGGLAAFGVLSLLSSGNSSVDAYTGATTQASLFSLTAVAAAKQWPTFAVELIGSIILGLGIATALTRTKIVERGVLYGGAILVASFMLVASGTVAVMNPVLAGGLQAYSHIDWKTFNLFPVLIYLIAPIVGASLGFGLYRLIEKATVTE